MLVACFGHACLLMNCRYWHAGFVLTTVEAIGDITATEEASALATFGDKHNRRVQGGLLGDGQYFGHNIALQSQNVCLSSETSSLHWKSELRNVWDSKHVFLFCEDVLALHKMQVAGVSRPAAFRVERK